MKDGGKNNRPTGVGSGASVQPINNIINQNNLVTPLATDSGSNISHIVDASAKTPAIFTTTGAGVTTPVPTVIEPPPASPYATASDLVAIDNNNGEGEDDDDEIITFALYTNDSYRQQLEQEEADRIRAQEKKDRPAEGRLVDGELRFDDDDEDEKSKERDPNLVEGSYLPEYMQHDFPPEFIGQPIEEIDPNIKDKTFVVITNRFRKRYIHRFTATKAFFILSPWNPVRRFMLKIATNQIFDYCIILTILVNCVFLALPESNVTSTAEYVFLAIYTLEAIIKVGARGFMLNTFTYLRDWWNWLDFVVIITAYLTEILQATGNAGQLGNVTALRTFRVLRALKTVSIVPGLKTIISALLRAMRMLAEVMLLTLFCMMMFALFALQVYLGALRQKCVKDMPSNVTITDFTYALHIREEVNWYVFPQTGQYHLCGNSTGAGGCPEGYTCLPNIGPNPNFGYTNFDHFGWAMLNSFQLITLDFWEDIYNKILRANGPWNVIFFVMVVFFGSFYLVNLMLAVVSMSYEEEAQIVGKQEKDLDKKKAKRMKKEKEKEKKRLEEEAEEKRRSAMFRVESDETRNKYDLSYTDTNHLNVNNGTVASNDTNGSIGNGSVNSINVTPRQANAGKNVIRDEPNNSAPKPSSDKGTVVTGSGGTNPLDKGVTPVASRTGGARPLTLDSGMGSSDKLVPPGGGNATTGDGVGHNNPALMVDDDDDDDNYSYTSSNNGDGPMSVLRADDGEEIVDRNCSCCNKCCPTHFITFLKMQLFVYKIVSDIMFELFITLCIFLNVLAMATEYYNMPQALEDALTYFNYIFTGIFILEAVLKIFGMSKYYFKSRWNIFDLCIVVASIIDVSLDNVNGLGILRAFRLLRLLRVFKLAQTWSTMRILLAIIIRTLGALGNLTLILAIVIYIFAVIGMQLFSSSYKESKFAPDDKPRWNFDDFGHSLMLIFRILCGEWIEPMWDCMRAAQEVCMVVFLPALVIGNFMVLNLFLALLLNSFATDSLRKTKDTKKDKMKQGWDKLKNLFKSKPADIQPSRSKNPSIGDIVDELTRRRNGTYDEKYNSDEITGNGDLSHRNSDTGLEAMDTSTNSDSDTGAAPTRMMQLMNRTKSKDTLTKDIIEAHSRAVSRRSSMISRRSSIVSKAPSIASIKSKQRDEDEESIVDAEDIMDCFPDVMMNKCCTCFLTLDETTHGQIWRRIRVNMYKVTEHKAFEYFILFIIFVSSISLCFEDIYLDDKPDMKDVLYYLNIVFASIFGVEMIMKWIAIGFKKYFTRFWTILDFCIVVISIVSLAAESAGAGQVSQFRSLRTLRALRPLRAISRWQGMKIVVNALVYAIPAIFNVLLVCLMFWLIFAIAGVQLFKGKFFKCVDIDGERIDAAIVPHKNDCLKLMITNGTKWKNSDINFDSVPQAYVALFQVATFEGWIEVMRDAVDLTTIDYQPEREKTMMSYIFFVLFIIVGAFFTLNLFIGVIIDNFNMLKKKYEGGVLDMFLTTSQKNYYNTMKKLGNRKPQKTIKRPKMENKIQCFFFDVAVSTKFELAIVILIFLNMCAMAIEHYQQPESFGDALDIINIVFTTIFTLEAIVKIIGLRWHYFRRAWNVFDFIIVLLSITGVILDDALRDFFITPTLLRVVRVFRIGRVLRLIKAAKGLRKLLFALVISLPALFNIGMLLLLITFIYAIFGMASFGNIQYHYGIDDITNFETFFRSMLVLFRCTTAAGWNEILEPMMEDSACNSTHRIMPDGRVKEVQGGNCGNPTLATFYMMSYIIITYLIIINMYIAVILENFNQAHEQEEVGITEDDFEMFYMVWERYDPHATQFIKHDNLADFVGDLDEPLGIPKPNEIALVAFDLSIVEGDRIHCLDILIGLVKHVLGGVEDTEEFKQLKLQMEDKYRLAFPTRVNQKKISSTMARKKEDVAAKTLQRAWRKHKAQQNIRRITEMAMEARNSQNMKRASLGELQRRPSLASGALSSAENSARGSPGGGFTFMANATAQQKKKQLGNTLKVPAASDVAAPTEQDVTLPV